MKLVKSGMLHLVSLSTVAMLTVYKLSAFFRVLCEEPKELVHHRAKASIRRVVARCWARGAIR